MIVLPGMEHYTKTFRDINVSYLRVTAHLKSSGRIVAYDPIYLDGLLAYAVLNTVTAGQGVPQNTPEPYWIPLPLNIASVDQETLCPLWWSTVFAPQGEVLNGTDYRHKRNPRGEFSNTANIKSNVGRWMERRMPIPTAACPTWEARCLGNREWVEKLLVENIAMLGKDRARGYGEVDRWEVEDIWPEGDARTRIFVAAGCLTHALPWHYVQHEAVGLVPEIPPTKVGWTPPFWKRPLFTLGWPVGTAVKVTANPFENFDRFWAVDQGLWENALHAE